MRNDCAGAERERGERERERERKRTCEKNGGAYPLFPQSGPPNARSGYGSGEHSVYGLPDSRAQTGGLWPRNYLAPPAREQGGGVLLLTDATWWLFGHTAASEENSLSRAIKRPWLTCDLQAAHA